MLMLDLELRLSRTRNAKFISQILQEKIRVCRDVLPSAEGVMRCSAVVVIGLHCRLQSQVPTQEIPLILILK